MTTAAVGYEPVYAWVKQVVGQTHRTVGRTVAWAVLCMVVAQRVTPAALARALPHEQAGSGRSCLRRVRRWWQGPALEQVEISPQLIRQALRVQSSLTSCCCGDGYDASRAVGSVGRWDRGGRPDATDRLGGDPVSLAQRALSRHYLGVGRPTARGVSR